MDDKDKTLLLDLLNCLKVNMDQGLTTPPMKHATGLCGYMWHMITLTEAGGRIKSEWDRALDEAAPSWKHHSGVLGYPIPCPDKLLPEIAKPTVGHMAYLIFRHFSRKPERWDKDHPYGALRYSLLCHLITTLEGEPAWVRLKTN